MGYVYFIQRGEHVKIGYAKNVQRRFWDLQCASPLPLNLVAKCRGGLDLEKAFHKRFSKSRERGEWFRLTPDLEGVIWNLRILPTRDKDGAAALAEDPYMKGVERLREELAQARMQLGK